MKALGGLVEMLGQEGAQRFLTMALPQIRQYRQELLTCLRQQEWAAAAALAHRLKATAHLYSSPILQDCLDRIVAQDVLQLGQVTFQSRLETEFLCTETEITRFLDSK
jgi:HPt (histidine-containing phosphotransfer) domain-containing protein